MQAPVMTRDGFFRFTGLTPVNADEPSPDSLQTLMRHKSYQTTQVYINLAR
jgi:hypothetical protein